MTMKKLLVIFFFIILISTQAQVNTEKYRTPDTLKGFAGYFEFSGTIKTGNSEKTEAGVDGRIDWKLSSVTTFLIFESDYEWVNGNRTSNEGLIHLRHVRNITRLLDIEFFGQVNYDKKVLIDNRELIGAGIRHKFLNFSTGDLTLGTAYMFEHENFNLPENAVHLPEVNVHRWSNYLSYFLGINPYVNFGGVVYYQPMFDNFSDYKLLAENSLTVKLTELISLSINFKLRHDSDPPDGIKQTDTKTDLGIAFKF